MLSLRYPLDVALFRFGFVNPPRRARTTDSFPIGDHYNAVMPTWKFILYFSLNFHNI